MKKVSSNGKGFHYKCQTGNVKIKKGYRSKVMEYLLFKGRKNEDFHARDRTAISGFSRYLHSFLLEKSDHTNIVLVQIPACLTVYPHTIISILGETQEKQMQS